MLQGCDCKYNWTRHWLCANHKHHFDWIPPASSISPPAAAGPGRCPASSSRSAYKWNSGRSLDLKTLVCVFAVWVCGWGGGQTLCSVCDALQLVYNCTCDDELFCSAEGVRHWRMCPAVISCYREQLEQYIMSCIHYISCSFYE